MTESCRRQSLNAQPLLLMIDVYLPDLNGFALCERLRARDPGGRLPVVFMTGNPSEDVERQAGQTEQAAYITKPFDYEQLIRVMADTFNV